jgi:hypothetical protein
MDITAVTKTDGHQSDGQCGVRWRSGGVVALLKPEGSRFESASSRSVGTLGKSFTRSCSALRRENPMQCPRCSRERLWVAVESWKRRYNKCAYQSVRQSVGQSVRQSIRSKDRRFQSALDRNLLCVYITIMLRCVWMWSVGQVNTLQTGHVYSNAVLGNKKE